MLDVAYDFLYIFFEAHIQHSVSFIQSQIRASSQICISLLDEIQESAGGSNEKLHSCS